jgi:flagellar basal body-associated protein FliL
MEGLMKGRTRILLLVVGAFLIAIPTVVVVMWLIGPQMPKLSFELLVTLNYLSTEFSPLVAFAYLWYSLQPSFGWVWSLLVAMVIALVVLAFLFYYVFPIWEAERRESEKIKK